MSPLTRLTALGIVLGLTGCTSSLIPGVETAGTDAGSGVEAAMADGECGAAQNQQWVGQSFTVLNDADLPETARVLFPGAAVTQEFNGGRLNIAIGTDDRITQVYCG